MLEASLVIINLILIECILSIDNAAVLAGMVKHLPKKQQDRAMTWGIWGAYILRGLCLVFAAWKLRRFSQMHFKRSVPQIAMWFEIIAGICMFCL